MRKEKKEKNTLSVNACFEFRSSMSRQVNEVKVLKDGPQLGLSAGDPKPGKKYPCVSNVKPNSPAHQKFIVGDQIVSVNGIDMSKQPYRAVHKVVRDTPVGQVVTFMIKPAQGMVLMGHVGRSLTSLSLDSTDNNDTPSTVERPWTTSPPVDENTEQYVANPTASPFEDDDLDGLDMEAFAQHRKSFRESQVLEKSTTSLEEMSNEADAKQDQLAEEQEGEGYIDLKDC